MGNWIESENSKGRYNSRPASCSVWLTGERRYPSPCARVSLRSRLRVSGSSAASGLTYSTLPSTMRELGALGALFLRRKETRDVVGWYRAAQEETLHFVAFE